MDRRIYLRGGRGVARGTHELVRPFAEATRGYTVHRRHVADLETIRSVASGCGGNGMAYDGKRIGLRPACSQCVTYARLSGSAHRLHAACSYTLRSIPRRWSNHFGPGPNAPSSCPHARHHLSSRANPMGPVGHAISQPWLSAVYRRPPILQHAGPRCT